jgi:general secretion pathway protein A
MPAATASAAMPAAAAGPAAATAAPIKEFVAAAAPRLGPQEAERFLQELPRQEAAALRQLAALWRLESPSGEPCSAAQARGVHCHRASGSVLSRVRLLDRPVVVTLQRGKEPATYALLSAVSDDSVTLRAGEQVRQIPLTTFAAHWQGEFSTFWRAPTGWSPNDAGATDPQVQAWMAARLARLDGRGAPPATGEALRAQVQAFQKANGLPGGGVPGPVTLMLINRASGVDEPRLTAGAQAIVPTAKAP